MGTIITSKGEVSGRKNVSIFTATQDGARDIRWAFLATGKDECRAVLHNTINVVTIDNVQWFVATDGCRLHATQSPTIDVEDGVYHLLQNTPNKIVAIRDTDAKYPDFAKVIPKETGTRKTVFVNYRLISPEKDVFRFKVASAVFGLFGSILNMKYAEDAAFGFTGMLLTIGQMSAADKVLFCNDCEDGSGRTRYAVIMPTRDR